MNGIADRVRKAPNAEKALPVGTESAEWLSKTFSVKEDILILKSEQCPKYRKCLLESGENKIEAQYGNWQ